LEIEIGVFGEKNQKRIAVSKKPRYARGVLQTDPPFKHVVIIGAGPAGLTAAAELVEHGVPVTVLEKDPVFVGGISRTAHYKGYRFDIGGHRFFSKSAEITAWWRKRLPDDFIHVRRMSRIYYRGKFFDYPLRAFNALFGLGLWTSTLCILSYGWARLFPVRPEKSFADWVSNRFGRKLFSIFFRTYTEKVWGTPCEEISADWAAQRIKGLSLSTAIWNALMPQRKNAGEGLVKTLIDHFEYPRLGPGMMWEKTRDDVCRQGGRVLMGREVVRIRHAQGRVIAVMARDAAGVETEHAAEEFIVSMPLRDTVMAFDPPLPEAVRQAAQRLQYRDFLTVALMIRGTGLFPDNWIYVHDPSVKLGRIQNFNNWSPEMVPENGMTCLGLEYFCFAGDGMWNLPDAELVALGKRELEQLGLARSADVADGCVVRMEKAYPVYGPEYQTDVAIIREALKAFPNFQVAGRNGMHKYNNQDHSMMSALIAARRLQGSPLDPWNVNTDAEYHEEASEKPAGRQVPRPA
jgi:protoporphyrinogen oxidase